MSQKLRLKFFHGLGDVVMFRNVLQLLDQPVELYLNPNLGQSQLFHGSSQVEVVGHPTSDSAFRRIHFYLEHSYPCQSGPALKCRVCLEHEFGIIRPDFKIRPLPITHLDTLQNQHVEDTHAFLKGLDPYVVCHFQGTSDPQKQNPAESFAAQSIAALRAAGWGVVVVNYDYVFHHPDNDDFPFIDQDQVRSTYQQLPMEVESLWTLLSGAHYFFGVDSGPLHLALGSTTPCAYIHHQTGFLENFYDEGLEQLAVVDATQLPAIPQSLIDQIPR